MFEIAAPNGYTAPVVAAVGKLIVVFAGAFSPPPAAKTGTIRVTIKRIVMSFFI